MYRNFLVFVLISIFSNVGASCPNIVSRAKWGAKDGRSTNSMAVYPVSHVVIHQSSTPKCTTQKDCEVIVRAMQKIHMNYSGRKDIGYNFVVGEDGNVYEGVGWNKAAINVSSYDKKSIHICIIGDYTSWLPSNSALTALKELIECGVTRGSISDEYRLVGHRQLEAINCPGMRLYQEIRQWSHWNPY